MKKLFNVSPVKIFIFCGLGVMLTLGSFWHHQVNQLQLDKMGIMKEALGTCFNRVSQSFTAIMIKDIRSPYLGRDFMSMSDECLGETVKEANPFKQTVGKGLETLKVLISEVHWFHEKILKIHSPMLAGLELNPSMGNLSERFAKMEDYKLNLVDEVDAATTEIRKIQTTDEFLMGSGLILFVLALSLLSLQEFNRLQLRKEIEKEALNFLKAGQTNIGALVDTLVDRALMTQGMFVTAQVFRDYHEELLERSSTSYRKVNKAEKINEGPKQDDLVTQDEETHITARSSLKEILVSLQNIHSKEVIQLSEVRDVSLAAQFEDLEQVLNAAFNKLSVHRTENKKILIANQIHSDRSVITMHLNGSTFSASELEFATPNSPASVATDVDMNMVILKEMANSLAIQWNLENKVDRAGKITGMSIRFVVPRAPRERGSKNLVSVIKGKKKDLAREMVN